MSEFGNHVCISHINVVDIYIYVHICMVSGSEFISELAATVCPKELPKKYHTYIHVHTYVYV